MHSMKKGSSESTRPQKLEIQPWFPLKAEEVENKVVELARKGETMSRIGLILRDAYGVPLVKIITGKTISQILKEHKITHTLPEDLAYLARAAIKIRKHLDIHHKDIDSRKGLQRIESKIRRLVKYYIAKGVLESKFKYDPETINIYMR